MCIRDSYGTVQRLAHAQGGAAGHQNVRACGLVGRRDTGGLWRRRRRGVGTVSRAAEVQDQADSLATCPDRCAAAQRGEGRCRPRGTDRALVCDGETPAFDGAVGRDELCGTCLLYTSDAADEEDSVDLGFRRVNTT